MTRRDILAQAWSFASAKASGRWHVFTGGSAAPAARAEPTDDAIWQEIHRILLRERRMADFLAERGMRAHAIAYEDLVADRRMVLLRVLDLLGVPPDQAIAATETPDDRTERLRYDGKHAALARFAHRHRALLEQVIAERDRIDPPALAKQLATAGIRL